MANEGQGRLSTIMSAVTLTAAYTGNVATVNAGKARKLAFYFTAIHSGAATVVTVEIAVLRRDGATYSVVEERTITIATSELLQRIVVRFAKGENTVRIRVKDTTAGAHDTFTAKVRADAVDVPITT